MISNDDHYITLPGQRDGLSLTIIRSITYCIKDFRVCTHFFCFFYGPIPYFFCGGCLRHQRQRDFPPLWRFLYPFFQLLARFHHQRGGAPARCGKHLRVGACANDDGQTAAGLRVSHQLVDALHIRAGGIQDFSALLPQTPVDRPALTVGADDGGAAGGNLLRTGHGADALLCKVPHHVLIVDNGPQHLTWLSGHCRLLGQLYRPSDAVAESGGLCDRDLQDTSSSSA